MNQANASLLHKANSCEVVHRIVDASHSYARPGAVEQSKESVVPNEKLHSRALCSSVLLTRVLRRYAMSCEPKPSFSFETTAKRSVFYLCGPLLRSVLTSKPKFWSFQKHSVVQPCFEMTTGPKP